MSDRDGFQRLLPLQTLRSLSATSVLLFASCFVFVFAVATHAQSPAPQVNSVRPLRVLLDPGHGGQDAGATRGDTKESEITLKLAQKLRRELEGRGFKAALTRESNVYLSLDSRAQLANSGEYDLLLSLHLNSSTDPRAKGKEFYFENQLSVDEESMFLASRENSEVSFTAGEDHAHSHSHGHDTSVSLQNLLRNMNDRIDASGIRQAESRMLPPLDRVPESARSDVKRILADLTRQSRVESSSTLAVELHRAWRDSSAVKHRSRGGQAIRQAPFYLLSFVGIPSVLVEVGFLSHEIEGHELTTDAYQNTLVQSIAEGLSRYQQRRLR
jgi:N-acetylmuramoyl-L-alanine amidase